MEALLTDQDLDQFVWNCIEHSTNGQDFLAYLQHTNCTYAQQEAAYDKMLSFWGNSDAPKLFDKVVSALTELAEAGNVLAMFHIARWYRLGYGVEKNEDIGLSWYRRGADAGCSRCLINFARYTAVSDEATAINMFRQASEMGNAYAHCFWADYDKARFFEHLALGAQSDESYAKYSYGYYLLKEADTDEKKSHALGLLQLAAEKGDSNACIYLSYCYQHGFHVEQADIEQAKYWAKKGARLGDGLACATLARLLIKDRATEQESELYMRRSAMLGNALGQTLLGVHLLYFGSTPELQAEGLSWLKVAAGNGHSPAMERLATALKSGKGGETNPQLALEWLKKGTAMGNADCQVELGSAYMCGDVIEQDQVKAHNLYHLASLQGNAWATYLLGLSYENGHGVDKNHKLAFACFMEAAQMQVTRAMYKVATAYLWGEGVEEDVPAGAKWLKQAAELGESDAQAYLGAMFAHGMGVEENIPIALRWLRKAADQDNSIALRELGFLYDEGKGVSQSREEATRLISKAASMGDQKALDWVDKHLPSKPEWLKNMCTGSNDATQQ